MHHRLLSAVASVMVLACSGAGASSSSETAASPAKISVEYVAATAGNEPGRRAPSLPPPEPDVVPELLGTPQQSLSACPWWGSLGYAPQVPPLYELVSSGARPVLPSDNALRERASAAALWNASEATPRDAAELKGEMLACAIRVDYQETKTGVGFVFPVPLPLPVPNTSSADLRATLGFGAFAAPERPRRLAEDEERLRLALSADGPDDTNGMLLTVPIVYLKSGDPVTLELLDRGVVTRDATFPTLRGRYQGRTPISLSSPRARAECRRVPRAIVEDDLELALEAAEEMLHHLDITKTGRLGEHVPVSELGARLRYAAALVGWSDPRVVRRRERAAQLFRRIHAETRADAEAKARALPAPGTWTEVAPGHLAIRVDGIGCGEAAMAEATRGRDVIPPLPGCALRVSVKNLSSEETSIWGGKCTITARASPKADPHNVDLRLRDRFGRAPPCDGVWDRSARTSGERVPKGAVTSVVFVVRHEGEFMKPWFGEEPRPFDGDLAAIRPLLIETFYLAERYGPAHKVWLRTE